MLDAIEALLFDRGNQLTVFEQSRCRITVVCVYAEDVQKNSLCSAASFKS
jgi:hypothetical protein